VTSRRRTLDDWIPYSVLVWNPVVLVLHDSSSPTHSSTFLQSSSSCPTAPSSFVGMTRALPLSHVPVPVPVFTPLTPQRIAYVYKAKREINGSRVRVIWGRVTRSHGNSGVVKSKFTSNLPARVFGASCRVVSGVSAQLTSLSSTSVPPKSQSKLSLNLLVSSPHFSHRYSKPSGLCLPLDSSSPIESR
jgi:hypothetical protein